MINSNLLQSLEWQGNSKEMYKAIMNNIPSFFVGSVRASIAKWVDKRHIRVVTEDHIFEAVREIAPANISSKIIPELKKLRSK